MRILSHLGFSVRKKLVFSGPNLRGGLRCHFLDSQMSKHCVSPAPVVKRSRSQRLGLTFQAADTRAAAASAAKAAA